jgi:hypothetical protein
MYQGGRKDLRRVRASATALVVAFAATTITGCAQRGAPSFVLFGAFFPAWMLLGGIGILAAIATRGALVATGLAEVLPLQLLVCVSAGLTIAVLVWLLWFAT